MEKAGIERMDASGRKLDFHALRYTFATMLARHNVSQRLAQELMRHSDPRLTANIYTDVTKLPTFEAVNDLPWPEGATGDFFNGKRDTERDTNP
jgi:integrase